MHVASIGTGPVVLFLHGFPELRYSCSHQLPHLSSRGYRAIGPDLQGWTKIIEEHEQDQEPMDQTICMVCRSEPCVCQIEEPSWAPAMMDRVIGMVERDKNHACVLYWFLGNKAGYSPNHSASAGFTTLN